MAGDEKKETPIEKYKRWMKETEEENKLKKQQKQDKELAGNRDVNDPEAEIKTFNRIIKPGEIAFLYADTNEIPRRGFPTIKKKMKTEKDIYWYFDNVEFYCILNKEGQAEILLGGNFCWQVKKFTRKAALKAFKADANKGQKPLIAFRATERVDFIKIVTKEEFDELLKLDRKSILLKNWPQYTNMFDKMPINNESETNIS